MTSDAKVSAYLDAQPPELADVGSVLRDVLDTSLVRAEGTLWHGHPVWMIGKTPVAGFKAYPKYVTLLIWRAAELPAHEGLQLNASGLGSTKLSSSAAISRAHLSALLAEAEALAE
ncbi:hypothetical protein EDF46_1523 [Frondihabitans sp. PhB188]|uniref:DUF1801 domain-containing protein n=1 Tax=Frondihabitans sp. PhB188 TaxID=2485200 RepID=UPI000F46AB1E|nr:DUF1801 domain-containing protein [Frondihabitans sp. PhB188]ROQ39888.1 hypothetical protein EDF46_1523 [Frondihabitans sp. PhB188]